MLERLDSIDWDRLPQPAKNAPGAVPRCIRRLAAAVTLDEATHPAGRFLWLVGNDHAGQYFPVALHTVPFLGEIIREGSPRRSPLRGRPPGGSADVRPGGGYETIVVPGHGERPLKDVLTEAVAALSDDLRRCADAAQSEPHTAELARDILHGLDHLEGRDHPDCDHLD
jgi:hypothetical protein